MKNLMTKLATVLYLSLVSIAAVAHPHHSAESANHIHFTAASLILAALVLVGYWLFSRYLRDRSNRIADSRERRKRF